MNHDPIIELQSVTFGYSQRLILTEADLKVFPGDFLSIVGPNGSGKSTLMKLMLGLLKPDKGKVLIYNQETASFNGWSRLGYLSQKATSFNPNFPATVREVVGAHTGTRKGLIKSMTRKDWEITDEILESLGLGNEKNCLVGRLSGGQQQRVFLARILVNCPEILFLDEPLVGIDIQAQEALQQLLMDLHKNRNMTIIMVTHDITYASTSSTRLVCIHNHKIFEHNPLEYSKTYIQERGLSHLYHLH